jgi:hypothetical protein
MPGDVHRLRNIETEEVSLVDRPANKRKFLLAKRDGETAMLKPDGRGGFVKVSKADDEEEMKRKSAEMDDEQEKKARLKARMDEKPEDKESRVKAGKSFYEVRQNRKRIFDNEEDLPGEQGSAKRSRKAKIAARKSDDSSATLASEISSHIDQVESLIDAIEQDGALPAQTQKLVDLHKGLGEICKKYGAPAQGAGPAPVEKVGRKMAASRLEMFQKALGNLQSILSELMDTPSNAKDHEAEPGDPQKPAAGWSAANPSGVPTGEQGTAGGVTKTEAEKLAKAAQELVDVTKSQSSEIATLKNEIKKLKGGEVPAGNSIKVEKSGNGGGGNDAPAWPLDMNRPIEKATVGKGESFYDD